MPADFITLLPNHQCDSLTLQLIQLKRQTHSFCSDCFLPEPSPTGNVHPKHWLLSSLNIFFISIHNMWVYEVQTKRESFKQNKHMFSCWQLQWLNTEHRLFCFSTCEVQTGCCLLSQKAIIPQTHDRLITYYTWLAGVFIQAKHLDSLQAESSKCVSVRNCDLMSVMRRIQWFTVCDKAGYGWMHTAEESLWLTPRCWRVGETMKDGVLWERLKTLILRWTVWKALKKVSIKYRKLYSKDC